MTKETIERGLQNIRILIVDDSTTKIKGFTNTYKLALRKLFPDVVLDDGIVKATIVKQEMKEGRADCETELLTNLTQTPYQAIVMDYSMPSFQNGDFYIQKAQEGQSINQDSLIVAHSGDESYNKILVKASQSPAVIFTPPVPSNTMIHLVYHLLNDECKAVANPEMAKAAEAGWKEALEMAAASKEGKGIPKETVEDLVMGTQSLAFQQKQPDEKQPNI